MVVCKKERIDMKKKVERVSNNITEILKTIPDVDCILLHESAERDIVNPYFFLSFDVYYSGSLPKVDERKKLFKAVGAFESSHIHMKDRFFLENLPVRIEYKQKNRVDTIIGDKEGNLWAFHDNGTYMFYRLQTGRIMYKSSNWIEMVRKKLTTFPESFWSTIRDSSLSSLEHYLVDISSAAVNRDDLFFMVSLSGYIKDLCSFMFAVNRKFEPSRRRLSDHIMELDIIPENFAGRFDSLIREDTEFPPSRKREVAKLLTKSLMHLY